MNRYDAFGYPLFFVAALEIFLGLILLKQNPRKSPVNKAVAAFAFASAGYSLVTAIMYVRTSLGLPISLYAKANWIGWLSIPAALQSIFYMQDEKSRKAKIVGFVLYPFWTILLVLCLFTGLVEPAGYSLRPHVDHTGPLENPARLAGALQILWVLYEVYRLRRRSSGTKRVQVNHFFCGTVIFGSGSALLAGFLQVFGNFGLDPGVGAYFSFPWVFLTFYAISRYRLFDISLIVSRLLTTVLLSVVISVLHLGLFNLFEPLTGPTLAILFSLFLIGMVFFGTHLSREVQWRIQSLLVKDRYDYQRVLKQSIRASITILNLDELLHFLIDSVHSSLEAESVRLFLQSGDGQYRLRLGRGENIPNDDGPVPDPVIAWLQRTGHVVMREDIEELVPSPELSTVDRYMRAIRAELLIPLLYKGQLQGFLSLGGKGSREPYMQSDLDLLESLAGHAAIAIENAQLYEEARQAKGSMRESEAKFDTLADTAAMAIFIHQGGNFLYANRAAEVIGGYTVDEYLTMDFMSLVHPDFIDLVKSRARERLGGGGEVPRQYEFKIVRKDGRERWVIMTAGISEFRGRPSVMGTLIDITARKQAEEERNKMALLVESSSDFIGMATLDGSIVSINSAGRRLVGLDDTADVKSMKIADFFMEEDLQPLLARIMPNDSWRGEFRLRNFRTGLPIPVEMYGFTVFDQDTGAPMARATVIRDITDLKHAREERERYYQQLQETTQSLQESEAKFRSLAETAPAAIFIHQGGKFLYANAASTSMIGYTREEFLNMDFWGVTHPEDKGMVVLRGNSRFTEDQAPPRYEFRIVTKEGEVRWLDMTVGKIEYEGKPAVIGTAFDITARKRAEEERERLNLQLQQALRSLQESEAKFRTLAETTTAAIFIHQGKKLVYANTAGEIMSGYSREDLLHEDFWALIHPDYQQLARDRGQARMRGEQSPREYEFKFIRKDGEERWAATTAGVIEYGGQPAIIATLFDITEWKRAEEAKVTFYEESVRQYQERIEEEKRHRIEKEKILMDLHDGIGGITTNISVLSELAQQPQDRENLARLLATISRLSREGISEIRGFMHSLDSKDLNWRTLASEFRSQGTNMVETHEIDFSIETEVDDIDDQPGSLIWVNLFKIYKEALTNIIKHAKATKVAVALQVKQDGVSLTIRDNGIGVRAARDGGRGLSNMKTRAQDIGGTISITREQGTLVRFELPFPLKYPAEGMAIR